MRTLLLDVGSRDNLSWEVEPFAEVVETLWGEGVVVVLPRELGLDITTGGKGLESLDHVEVLGVNVWVLWEIVVLSALRSNQYVFGAEISMFLRLRHPHGRGTRGSFGVRK